MIAIARCNYVTSSGEKFMDIENCADEELIGASHRLSIGTKIDTGKPYLIRFDPEDTCCWLVDLKEVKL